jgi:pimeloyl-ACP methyl ester carboxylesterase
MTGATADDPWRFERLELSAGLHLRAAVAGESGPLVLMLHGFPESWYSWRHQLRALSPSCRCVAPELRGYGESDAPRGVENYTVEKLADDVRDLIRCCGRERAMLIGHDWGGAIAWVASLMHPEMVERLVILNCPHPRQMRRHLRSNFRQLARSWYIFFFQLPWLPEFILRAGDFALPMRAIREGAVRKEAFTEADLAHFRQALSRPYALTAALNYYRALARRDFLCEPPPDHWLARKVRAPTLVIWGEQDIALTRELTYGMEDLFAREYEIKYVPDSGHWVQQEQPELVNRYILEVLSGAAA